MTRKHDPSDNRRFHQRYAVEGVHGSFQFSTDARVMNLSVDGMAIQTGNPLKVGREYSLKLSHEGSGIPLIGRIVWCSLVKTERDEAGDVVPVYRAGIHFERVLSESAAELQRFIEDNAVISLEKRLFGRFRIDSEKAADLRWEAEFLVRQMSLTGMLIETDVLPQVDTVHHMEIRFPEVKFDAQARIAHSESIEAARESDEEALYRLGVEFVELSDEARRKLEEFIASEAG